MNSHLSFLLLFTFVSALENSEYRLLNEGHKTIPECVEVLRVFAESSSNFTLCTVKYSQPIQACENCVVSYMDVVKAHQDILTTEVNGTKCRDKLINLDRLEIVESTFRNTRDIWDRGFCDKCFDWVNSAPVLSNQTKKFVEHHKIAMDCINGHYKNGTNNTDAICKSCMSKYLSLNSFYESLKGKSETVGICMDIVDLMNTTRSIWSEDLKCCKLRRTPEFIFLVCSGVITALPALFYFYARYYCDDALICIPADQRRMAENRLCMPSTSSSQR